MSALSDLNEKYHHSDSELTPLEYAVLACGSEDAALELEGLRFENKSNRRLWESFANQFGKLQMEIATGEYYKKMDAKISARNHVLSVIKVWLEESNRVSIVPILYDDICKILEEK